MPRSVSHDIALLRLAAQQLTKQTHTRPADLVGYMGAMQAQDAAMARWAVGIRLQSCTDKTVLQALDKGTILRTHVLRPTWHLVHNSDLPWMVALTAPQIKKQMSSRNKQLGLTAHVLDRCMKLIGQALTGGHTTREALLATLKDDGIDTDENRASHILMWAEMEQLICSGPFQSGRQTYALLADRIKKPKKLSREESLAELAHRYFISHGPAAITDFIWWSGLPVKDAKAGWEAVCNRLEPLATGNKEYWMKPGLAADAHAAKSLLLLPAYDEYLISYKDRSASLHTDHHKRTISSNGIFWPTIVKGGSITGTWKRNTTDKQVTLTIDEFATHSAATRNEVKKRVSQYGDFIERDATAVFTENS